jgi:uncharacterized NAD(P)/FAD-binding protein YdhS
LIVGSSKKVERYCCDVSIVGGGFSGTDLSIHLLRRSKEPLSIVVIDRGTSPGRGVAFSTACEGHVLNVTPEKMSAIAEEPEHFVSWLMRVCGDTHRRELFVPRHLYGKYMEDTLNQAIRESHGGQLSWVRGNAISLEMRGTRPQLMLDGGPIVEARVVVLATGNTPPSDPPPVRKIARPFYAPFVWAQDALEGVPSPGAVLLLGSGLTAVDQVIELREKGFCGPITMLSRRGKLPAVHCPSATWNSDWTLTIPCTVSGLVAVTREQVRLASEQGVDWTAVIDCLRPQTSRIWRQWLPPERKRFLRHIRSFWEPARHRLSAKTHSLLMNLVEQGDLRMIAGRLLEAKEEKGRVVVTLQERSQLTAYELPVDRIINCTGPGTTDRIHDQLISSTVKTGLARFDPLHIGIDTNSDGSIIDASGDASACIYGIGPLRKGSLWETTAVAEIREQAVSLAERILEQLMIQQGSRLLTKPSPTKSRQCG